MGIVRRAVDLVGNAVVIAVALGPTLALKLPFVLDGVAMCATKASRDNNLTNAVS
jgi:hypothetical protein